MEGSASERAPRNLRRGRDDERREIAFFVRAKTGLGSRDWSQVGVAFERRNGQAGFSIKLNTLPISKDWNGSLVLVPPRDDSEDLGEE